RQGAVGDVVTKGPLAVYSGRRVLVTGHTGFKGPWLCVMLQELGADVCGYALAPEEGSHFRLLELDRSLKHVEGDIRDIEHLVRVTTEHEPEFVFHLAARALLLPSYDDPVGTFSTNVMGSVNVLEAVR